MTLCCQLVLGVLLDTGSRPSVVDDLYTGSRPIINSLKSASLKPSKIFIATLVGGCVVVSQTLLQKMVAEQEAEMEERAKKDVESGAVAQMMVNQVKITLSLLKIIHFLLPL